MTATTKMPGHQRQLVPGVNSNPVTHEGEAVMSRLQYESTTAEIIANIAKAMEAQGLDETALSEAADMEETDLLNIMSLREILDVESLVKIATALGAEFDDLLPPAGTFPAETFQTPVPPWAKTSTQYHADSDDEPVAVEHHGPTAGVLAGGGVVAAFISVSQLAMKDGTIEPPMVRVEQDGESEFEFPLRLIPAFIDALETLQNAMNERLSQPMDEEVA